MATMKTMKWTRVASLFHTFSLIFITCHNTPTVLSAPAKSTFDDDLPSLNQSLNFKCEKPQPRAYNLMDLLIHHHHPVHNERPHQPSYIVVYRCDGHAGCCNVTNKICKPIKDSIYYKELEFEFMVTDSHNYSEITRKTISIEHHGKCRCAGAGHNEREKLEQDRPSIKFVES